MTMSAAATIASRPMGIQFMVDRPLSALPDRWRSQQGAAASRCRSGMRHQHPALIVRRHKRQRQKQIGDPRPETYDAFDEPSHLRLTKIFATNSASTAHMERFAVGAEVAAGGSSRMACCQAAANTFRHRLPALWRNQRAIEITALDELMGPLAGRQDGEACPFLRQQLTRGDDRQLVVDEVFIAAALQQIIITSLQRHARILIDLRRLGVACFYYKEST